MNTTTTNFIPSGSTLRPPSFMVWRRFRRQINAWSVEIYLESSHWTEIERDSDATIHARYLKNMTVSFNCISLYAIHHFKPLNSRPCVYAVVCRKQRKYGSNTGVGRMYAVTITKSRQPRAQLCKLEWAHRMIHLFASHIFPSNHITFML